MSYEKEEGIESEAVGAPRPAPAGGPPRIQLSAKEGEQICPFCRDDLALEAAWTCECGVSLHETCRAELGGCTTIGCTQVSQDPRAQEVARRAPPGFRPRPFQRPQRFGDRLQRLSEGSALWIASAILALVPAFWCGWTFGHAAYKTHRTPPFDPEVGPAISAALIGGGLGWIASLIGVWILLRILVETVPRTVAEILGFVSAFVLTLPVAHAAYERILPVYAGLIGKGTSQHVWSGALGLLPTLVCCAGAVWFVRSLQGNSRN